MGWKSSTPKILIPKLDSARLTIHLRPWVFWFAGATDEMPTQAASTTRINLRRAQSTPLIPRRPSSSTLNSLIDPVAARQHALVAANVAFERSCHGKGNNNSYQQQSSQLHRKRSNQASGFEGEGSHFHQYDANKTPRHQRSSGKRGTQSEDVVVGSHAREGERAVSTATNSTAPSSSVATQDFALREIGETRRDSPGTETRISVG